MLMTLFVILALVWLIGMVTSFTMGGYIHVFLFLAVLMLIIRLIKGRRVV